MHLTVRSLALLGVLLSVVASAPAGLVGQLQRDGPLPGIDPARPLGQLSLDLWTEREGLPQNFVTSLAQTPDGYLWAGTERGLVRFDGVRFTTYTPQDVDGLPAAWVTALHTDAEGNLWIGTGGGDVVRYADGAFSVVEGDVPSLGVPVSAIVSDDEGRVWAGTEGRGVIAVERTPEGPALVQVLDEGQVSDLARGPEGRIWVATGDEALGLDPESGEVDREVATDDAGVQALHVDPDGTVWLGTWGDGLFRLREGALDRPAGQGELSGAFVTVLERDREGALWIGTNGTGLHRKRDGGIERLPERAEAPTHLVQALMEDREGNLWMGLIAAGLARLQDGMFDHVGAPEGLSMNVALGVLETTDGAVWVGSPGGGLNQIRGDEVRAWRTTDGLGSDFVLSVSEGPEGEVWAGTSGGGVSRIHEEEVSSFGRDDGLPGEHVSVVHHAGTGHLWLGFGGEGLLRWQPGPPRHITVDDGLPHGFVTAVAEDADGLWVGTRNGVARIEEGEVVEALGVEDGLPQGFVAGLHLDAEGGLWVATLEGLARVRDGRVAAFGTDVGLPTMEAMGVIDDDAGRLWISTTGGLVHAPRRELDQIADGERERLSRVRVYDRAHGLRSAEANGAVQPSAWRGEDGSLWFPTMAGLVRVDPERTERSVLPVTPKIESMEAGGRRIRLAGPEVELAPGERTLEFRVAAPTFVAPERIRLRYRLEGSDEDWIIAEDTSPVRYTDLSPGEYRFRVEASDRQGRWTGREDILEVDVPFRFHERPEVRAAGLALLLLTSGLGYRARIRRLKERERVLMEAVAERERARAELEEREDQLRQAQKMEAVGQLAGGVAHDLNNLLTVVSMSTHLAKDLRGDDDPAREDLDAAMQATERASELIRQLLAFSRRQVLQPQELDLNECVREVEGMLRRLTRDDVEFDLRLEPELAPIRADRSGIEQILVNLVVNAQDAMPDGGTVTITTANAPGRPEAEAPVGIRPHVALAVVDTGVGMDAETKSRVFEPFFTTKGLGEGTGMGLASVHGIVHQSGGSAEVASRIGVGTTFTIRFPRAEDVGTQAGTGAPGRSDGSAGARDAPGESGPAHGVANANVPGGGGTPGDVD